jgi:hypothetical protein
MLFKVLITFHQILSRYVKHVKRELERIEKIIRLVIGPVDILVESYKTNFPDHNEMEFVKIMDLKVYFSTKIRTLFTVEWSNYLIVNGLSFSVHSQTRPRTIT